MKMLEKVSGIVTKGYVKACVGVTALVGFVMEECPLIALAAPGDLQENGDADAVTGQITGPMLTLIKVILSVMAVVGIFMLVKSILELINAVQQQDNTGMFHAGRGIAVSLLMIAITPVVSLFVDLG